ncbi:uncharacterized protein DSM5745_06891 [Aspergillus mulundensis]|uniref:Glycosyltransferase family 25 protein n=1 Tax=Aspergillus mulundensis TaxID=1810919 RepID=A0A3D8RS83_9EURO|nr:Uncharacterized protein DSM5745_06891 [Aspergillus mulundensis]RDW76899.1 Uncharacterized protein DSM5745_06891 [Aspergillus mulundensis]
MSRSAAAWAFAVRWRWYLCVAPAVTLLWMLYLLSSQYRPRVVAQSHSLSADNTTSITPVPAFPGAGNATLGFEAILALSPFPSWRTTGLQAAAQLTGLDIQIPPQPPINPELVDAFAGLGPEDARHPNHGSALAWVAHLDLIKHVVQSDFETSLIVEDDVDWDVSIKEQMVGVAEAVRRLTKTKDENVETTPYGQSWDVLWVGLCAETWDHDFETVFIDDETVISAEQYVGLGKAPVDRLPEGRRAVFYSGAPICTFAYALTKAGARNVLLDVGAGKDEAFDISLMNGCRERNLTCISVLPELFRHYIPSEKVGGSSLVNAKGDDSNTTVEEEMGHTENILQSARCHALWGRPCLA